MSANHDPGPATPSGAHQPHAARTARPGWERLRRSLTAAGFLAAGGLAWWWLSTHHFTGGDHAGQDAGHAAAPPEAAARRDVVVLPPTAAGEIELVEARTRTMREHLTVPGRLDYDARYQLDYESPVAGIVSRVFVQVRQRVSKGDSLAEVSSPEVGIARDEVRKREDDRVIERKAAEWADTIAENVDDLLEALDDEPPLEQIEERFQDRVLGAYREKILAAYSRLLVAEKVSASTRQLGEGGVLSGRIVEERTSTREVARASFVAACEEARFLTRQDRARARAALEQADRLVQVSKENLRTLVGSKLESDTGGTGATNVADAEEPAREGGSLSALVLRTPFAGLVEDVFVSRGERVQAGDRLFVVADTANLWVRAQIHERQWTTVELTEGQEVHVTVPGPTEHNTTARISHVGATVEQESRSVPLVAELENDDAHYKPGMFVWVDLPQGSQREALAVPAAAIMRHEGKAFVFVPDGAGRYRRVDVEPGIEQDGFLEVKAGLEPGQQVVARGAFLLKSELLLEDEA